MKPGIPVSELVVVEHMPACFRESHRAARNWGNYPLNGAMRCLMLRADAESVVAEDDDGYDSIIRDARPADLDKFAVLPHPEVP